MLVVSRTLSLLAGAALLAAGTAAQAQTGCAGQPSPCARDFAIAYPEKPTTLPDKQGSTHEIASYRKGGKALWMTAPNYGEVVSVGMEAAFKFHKMPDGVMPHGITFDAAGHLGVTFEHLQDAHTSHGSAFNGQVAQLDPASGKVLKRYHVNTDPHGIGIGPDGKTVWFTGKTKGTVGYLKNGKPVNFQLSNKDAFPIYIAAGADGNMWFTELQASKIGRVTPRGKIDEFRVPTGDSRPIAIIPDPKAKALWFSEEAGNNVARIDMKGEITEFPVPPARHDPQPAYILAGLAFDADGNLWT
jgi:virginiamycin B lyase